MLRRLKTVSSGITFLDYREAREYQEMLLKEGINSHLARAGGKYVVVPKEKVDIKTEVKSVARQRGYSGEHWTDKEERHYISIKPHASTGTKLHEIGHAVSGHRTIGGQTTGEIIERELDAEIYALRMANRPIDYRAGWNSVLRTLNETNIGPESAINEVARRMEKRGIRVPREGKQWLFDHSYAKTDDPEEERIKAWIREQF